MPLHIAQSAAKWVIALSQVAISRKTQTIQKAIAKGHMKDEADLTEKYGKKPDQLAAIMQNAMSSTCPIRRVQLWADPDFCTEWNFIQEDNTDQVARDSVQTHAVRC